MSISIGFCEEDGSGFLAAQPLSHMERWQLPEDNGTHV